MLEDSLKLMEKRLNNLNKSVEVMAVKPIKEKYPALVDLYKQGKINYRSLLQIYNKLEWEKFAAE